MIPPKVSGGPGFCCLETSPAVGFVQSAPAGPLLDQPRLVRGLVQRIKMNYCRMSGFGPGQIRIGFRPHFVSADLLCCLRSGLTIGRLQKSITSAIKRVSWHCLRSVWLRWIKIDCYELTDPTTQYLASMELDWFPVFEKRQSLSRKSFRTSGLFLWLSDRI